MDLSIVIVNWNTKDMLMACLHSVVDNLNGYLDYEITVVDNASSDGSAEMVRKYFPSVNLISNDKNVGYVQANNQATEVANGKFILLLNSDTRMTDSGATEVVDYLEKNSQCGIVTGRMLHEDGTFQPPYRRFPGLPALVARNTIRRIIGLNTPFLKRFRYEDLNPDQAHEIDWATGAYLYIRREVLKRGKVFDEDIFMYFEDTLLCKRVREAGYSVIYLPVAPIYHYRGKSAKKARPTTVLYSFQGSVVYVERLYGPLTARLYRQSVRSIWWLSAVVLKLLPSSRSREKAELFRFLYTEDTHL